MHTRTSIVAGIISVVAGATVALLSLYISTQCNCPEIPSSAKVFTCNCSASPAAYGVAGVGSLLVLFGCVYLLYHWMR